MSITQKILKVREFPPEWAKEFPNPDVKVRLEIKEVDPTLDAVRTLDDVMDLISERAQQRGLTADLLQEILNER